MLTTLRKLLGANDAADRARIPEGQRVYAVGDIHGCDDQFAALIAAIEADDAARRAAETTVILLGDLVDRGPDSAGVLRRARAWQSRRKVRILAGNHEEMFLLAFTKRDVLKSFLRHGGRETLLSYPIDPAEFAEANFAETQRLMTAAIPAEDRAFMATFEDQITIGDYLFVHAGVRPGVPLDAQRLADLRWIREDFIDHRTPFGPIVVHGHTITAEVDIRTNRIGIDTGAYNSGRLTALGLQGPDRWLIEASGAGAAVTTSQRKLA
jgi:serine/threonine protein phosphatase 1